MTLDIDFTWHGCISNTARILRLDQGTISIKLLNGGIVVTTNSNFETNISIMQWVLLNGHEYTEVVSELIMALDMLQGWR